MKREAEPKDDGSRHTVHRSDDALADLGQHRVFQGPHGGPIDDGETLKRRVRVGVAYLSQTELSKPPMSIVWGECQRFYAENHKPQESAAGGTNPPASD